MCGRMTLTLDKQTVMDILQDRFQVINKVMLHEPSYNIGPSQEVLSIIEHKGELRAGYLNFGFKSPWNEDYKPVINARSETIEVKPMFKSSFISKRCIVLVDSFYEWKRDKEKRAYRFQVSDDQIMGLAGIYTTSKETNNKNRHGVAIVTCEPNKLMEPIHHRMPVILSQTEMKQWLNKKSSVNKLKSMMIPYSANNMMMYEVSTYVNSMKHNDLKCIEKILT